MISAFLNFSEFLIDFFFRKSGFDRLKKSVNQDARIDFFFLKKIAQFYDYSL